MKDFFSCYRREISVASTDERNVATRQFALRSLGRVEIAHFEREHVSPIFTAAYKKLLCVTLRRRRSASRHVRPAGCKKI